MQGEFTTKFLETVGHPTPFFMFSQKKVLAQLERFKECFPNSLIQYAMKANSEPEILKTLSDAGCGFEAASVFELNILKKLKVSADKIVYGTSVKPAAHISEFHKYGVDRFAFDSLAELEKLAIAAPGSRVYVRVNTNDSGSVFRFSEKFGTEIENIIPLLSRAKELGLKPYGISFHVGSQAGNMSAWAHTIKNLSPVLKELAGVGIKIDVLNIGGGYPCKYLSGLGAASLEEISEEIYDEYESLPYQPKLMLEPGRGLIAETGVLVATIIGKVERGTGTWLFLDAGVYNALYETMAFQGSTRYNVTSLRQSYDAGEALFSLAGPTGDSQDVITREALLPQDISVGDKLLFHDVGAYSLVTSSPFNGFPRPEVYFV